VQLPLVQTRPLVPQAWPYWGQLPPQQHVWPTQRFAQHGWFAPPQGVHAPLEQSMPVLHSWPSCTHCPLTQQPLAQVAGVQGGGGVPPSGGLQQ
jgi:hypothetical protein